MTSTGWNPWKMTAIGLGLVAVVNENRKTDERHRVAYASGLRSRGYAS
jgi:hypothetical protein